MTEARGTYWRRAGALAALAAAATHPGCSCSDDSSETPSSSSTTTTTSATSTSSGSGGGGGAGGQGGAGGAAVELPYAIAQVTNALAFDATPSPDGGTVYFTGLSTSGKAGVFRASAGGGSVTPVTSDPAFVAPVGIAVSSDGAFAYVADPGVTDAYGVDAGQIVRVSTGDGSVAPLGGTEGSVPRGLEVRGTPEGDEIVYAGVDKGDGAPAVFRISAQGGAASIVVKGAPLVDPSGIAVASNGDIYVCDTLSSPDKSATVFKFEDGFLAPFATGLHAGYPCGIALTADDATLFVLAKTSATGTDQVVQIDVASKSATTLSAGIDAFGEPAGLHRAKRADVFAFADSQAQDMGAIFLMKQ